MLRGKGSVGLSFSLGLIAAVPLALGGRGGVLAAAAAAAGAASIAVTLLPARAAAPRWAGAVLLAAALGCAGGLARTLGWTRESREGPAAAALAGVTSFVGVLDGDSRPDEAGDTRYVLRLRGLVRGPEGIRTPARGRVFLRAKQGPRAWRGQVLRVRGTLRPWPQAPAVQVEPAGPGGRPAAGGLASGTPAPFALAGRAERGGVQAGGFASPAAAVRARLLPALEARSVRIGEPAAALFRGFFLGERDGIPASLQQSFTRSGSVHLLAISGQHLGILALLAAGCLFWLPSRRWRMTAAALLAGGYFFLIGPLPSLSRAVLMLAAGSLGALLDRDPEPLNLLGLSAAVLVLADPSALTTLSFQLSYLALLGILLVEARLSRALSRWLPPFLCPPLAASLGANLCTMPLLLAAFGAAYPAGALAALPLVPLVTVFMAGGLACLLLPAFAWGALAGFARPAMRLLYELIARLLGFFAAAPAISTDPAARGPETGLPLGWLLLPVLLLIGVPLPGCWKRLLCRRALPRGQAGATAGARRAPDAPALMPAASARDGGPSSPGRLAA